MAHNNSHTTYTIYAKNLQSPNELAHTHANPASRLNFSEHPSPLAHRSACVVDLDNVCSRRGQHGRRAWASLDLVAFVAALRRGGVTEGTVFQNQKPADYAVKLWAAAGLKSVAIGKNVDPWVKLAAVNHASEGLDRLILVASDGGYDEVIHAIRGCGIRVELWALRSAVAKHLVYAADAVRWIDGFLREPDLAA